MMTLDKLLTKVIPDALKNFSSEPLQRVDHQHVRKETPATPSTPKAGL